MFKYLIKREMILANGTTTFVYENESNTVMINSTGSEHYQSIISLAYNANSTSLESIAKNLNNKNGKKMGAPQHMYSRTRISCAIDRHFREVLDHLHVYT